jgi:hypothetical protein
MRSMTKLPEFLRSRLALRQRQPGEHPSAGLLAEFAERTLPTRERAEVLEHLARCAECREVLAAASTPDISGAPRAAWWKWRWATAAAAACLVAALFWRPGSIENSSWNIAPSPPAAPAAPKEEEPKAAEKQPAKKQIASQREGPKAKPKPQQSVVEAELPPPPQVAIAQTEPPPIPLEAMNGRPRESAPHPAESEKSAAIEPPRDRTRLEAPNMLFQSGIRANAAKTLARRTSRPERGNSRWNLEGTLRKSDDAGKTWRIIQVDDRARLYALSAAGSSVWVGGANGALFHSVDDGREWTPSIVADHDGRLTDTITRIEARDDNWVKLTTRSGDWLTLDGGAHWRRE